jgi:hypothetical protein
VRPPCVEALCRGASKLEFAAGGAVEGRYCPCAFPLFSGMNASVPARVVPCVAVRRLPPGAPMPMFAGYNQSMFTASA